MNAQSQAMLHCMITIPIAHLAPSSLLTEATAATHGVYSRQKTKNAIAVSGVKIFDTTAPPVNKTLIVDTTLSLAINPEISAEDNLQSPNPSGSKNGAIAPETPAKILSFESETIDKL